MYIRILILIFKHLRRRSLIEINSNNPISFKGSVLLQSLDLPLRVAGPIFFIALQGSSIVTGNCNLSTSMYAYLIDYPSAFRTQQEKLLG